MKSCTICEKGLLREGSIYRTHDDDGAPRALLGLECTACGHIEPDAAHIAEALAQGAQVTPWARLQLEVAVVSGARSLAERPVRSPTRSPASKSIAVEWREVPRRVFN
jgi:hypothetical protein